MKINILIIDDEQAIRELLSELLSLENYNVHTAADASQAIRILNSEDIHLVITDVKLPDKNGLELISEIKQINPNTEIIVLTAFGTIQDGVKAMREGAFDYIVKGDEDTKIIPLVRNIEKKIEFIQRIKHLENKLEDKYTFDRIVGNSPSVLSAIHLAKKVAASDVPVLLLGETGTGKEIFARAIHFDGCRKHKNFIALNCSSFSKDLLETEMFGYKAGAFTGAVKNKKGLFEEANGGTIFLDEIGDLDIALQSKLLRVLETGSFIKVGDTKTTNVDARIIAATNKNLESAIKNNLFRADLFYRISVFQITLPPLRTRKEDLPDLVRNFVDFYSKKFNRPDRVRRAWQARLGEERLHQLPHDLGEGAYFAPELGNVFSAGAATRTRRAPRNAEGLDEVAADRRRRPPADAASSTSPTRSSTTSSTSWNGRARIKTQNWPPKTRAENRGDDMP